MHSLAHTLITAGLVLLALGLLLHWGPQIPVLGKLPGDIRIERGGMRLYLPITSCVLVSLVVSLALSLLGRWR